MKKLFDDMNVSLDGVYWEITSICNSFCPYCYNNSRHYGENTDFLVFQKVIDEVSYYNGEPHIIISGGEPTLHPKINCMLDYLKNKKIMATIITNGSTLDCPDIQNGLVNHHIQITLENVDQQLHDKIRGVGNFSAVESGVKVLKHMGHKGKVTMRVNVSRRNYNDIEKFLQIALQWKCDEIAFSFLCSSGRAVYDKEVINFSSDAQTSNLIVEKIDEMMSKYHERPISILNKCKPKKKCVLIGEEGTCFQGKITPDGSVYPCQGFHSEDFIIGNVNSNSLKEISNSAKFIDFINSIRRRTQEDLNCGACIWKSVCKRGCPALAYDLFHSLEYNSGECSYLKKSFLHKAWTVGMR